MDDALYMQMAIDEAKKCPEGVPRVGVVIVKDGEILSTGHRDKAGPGIHAERGALEEILQRGLKAKDSTVYTTLEPCSSLTGSRTPCAKLLVEAKVKTVFIGTYDRNPNIYRKGWRTLRDGGVVVRDFKSELREAADTLNLTFSEFFLSGEGLEGGAKFDYSQNGGQFDIYFDSTRTSHITTRWSQRGADSIYANAGVPGKVALANYAKSFSEIDDPDALDYASHFAAPNLKDIVVYRNNHGHALIQVMDIEAGPSRGKDNTAVKIRWQLRPR